MTDDSGDAELKVEHSSILDPYVLLLRDDRSCTLLKADKKGELDEVEHGELLAQHKWASGCLCLPDGDDSAPLAILLSTDGALHVSFSEHYLRERDKLTVNGLDLPTTQPRRTSLFV